MLTERKPEWLRVRPPSGDDYAHLKSLLRDLRLHTVCEEAHCPNVGECWGGGTATIMLMGDVCTRACRFCAVTSGNPRAALDAAAPGNVARTIREIKRRAPTVLVEALIPDFRGDLEALRTVVDAAPDVLDHNVETVRRLQRTVRDRRAGYDQSLSVLRGAKGMRPSLYTKSSIMLGLGETREEVIETMRDLRVTDVDILTLGQYLRPSDWHLPVREFVPPGTFDEYRVAGEALGFLYVAAGPLVRSSYRAGEFFLERAIRDRRTPGA